MYTLYDSQLFKNKENRNNEGDTIDNKCINISTIADGGNIKETLVLINSLIKNTSSQTIIDLHIISPYGNISQHIPKYKKSDNIKITYHVVKGELYQKYNKRKKNTLKYILLDIENILKLEKETVYIEPGGIVLKGWEKIIEYESNKIVYASRKNVKSSVTRNLHIPYEKYYDTKFMYMNLEKMRDKKISCQTKLIENEINNPEDAFNKILHNDVYQIASTHNINLKKLLECEWDTLQNTKCIGYLDISDIDLTEIYIPNISELYLECAEIEMYPIDKICTCPTTFRQETSNDNCAVSIIIDAEKYTDDIELNRTINSIESQSLSPTEVIIYVGKNQKRPGKDVLNKYVVEENLEFKPSENHFILIDAGDIIHPATLKIISPLLKNNENIITNYNIINTKKRKEHISSINISNELISKKTLFLNYPGRKPFILQSDLFKNINQMSKDISEGLEIENWIKINNDLFYYTCSETKNYTNYSVKIAPCTRPEVSIIIPIYNGAAYLKECLNSIYSQTYADKIEIICINDCSEDNSLDILMEKYTDDKTTIINLGTNSGPGIARNIGYKYARGTYILFLDGDDIFDPRFIEEMVTNAKNNSSEIVICKSDELDDKTKTITYNESMYREWMLANCPNPFSPQELSEYIFNFVNSWAWDKIFLKELLDKNQLIFDNTRRNQDMRFTCMAMAHANKIYYLNKTLIQHRKNIPTSQERKGVQYPYTVYEVGKAWKENLITTGLYNKYYSSYINRIVPALIYTLKMCKENKDLYAEYIIRLRTEIVKELDLPLDESQYYSINKNQIKYLNRIMNDPIDLILCDEMPNRESILKTQYSRKVIKTTVKEKIIISLTTYPARISTVHLVLNSLLNQTIQADKIELWLAESQFPLKEQELPKKLLRLRKKIDIKWCDDLKPHKKYYYAFKNNPDAIVITVDDDVIYCKTLVEKLLNSYLHCPYAVSAMRVNKITFDRNGNISKYRKWEREYSAKPLSPSMDLLATGVGGVLYPPKIFSQNVFDKDAILECALFADDLWLKINELMCGIPTVLASPPKPIKLIDETQDSGLFVDNVYADKNDAQFNNLLKRYDMYDFNKIIRHKRYISSKPVTSPGDQCIITFKKKYYFKKICDRIGCLKKATYIYNKIVEKLNL